MNQDQLIAKRKKYYEDHKALIAIQRKIYHENNKEQIAIRRKVYDSEYRTAHKKERAIANKVYYETHKDEILEKSKQLNENGLTPQIDRAKKNPFKFWAIHRLSQHGKNYKINITSKQLSEMAMNTPTCFYCGATLDYEPYKRKTPRQKASLDRKDNGQEINENNISITCLCCNITKRSRTHAEFVEYCKKIAKKFT